MTKNSKAAGRRLLWAMLLAAVCLPLGGARAEPKAKSSHETSKAESVPRPPSVKPLKPEELDASIARGVAFLVHRQNPDGSWGSARNTTGADVYAPVPGAHQAFRAAVTAMCVSALIEVGCKNDEQTRALDRGEAWLLEHLPKLRRADATAIYNNWGHAYGIQGLVRMYNRLPDDKQRRSKIKHEIQQQIELLGRYECVDGGWCYYDFNARTQKPSGSSLSFVSATVLVALYEAQEIGVEIPQRLVQRAVTSIDRQRKPDFSYMYGEYLKWWPMEPINRPGGSLGRSQACNLATRLWGDKTVTDAVLVDWLDRIFARNLWLDLGRKRPVPHESWFSVAGYFFYYGHYYAARCIEQLPPAERPRYQDLLTHVLVRLQERDGSWWDFPLYDYHQQYGTAFALMSLVRCRHGKSGS